MVKRELVKEVAVEIAIHVPDDVAVALPWDDVSRHILEQIALEG
jgi:hypothetical protein